MTALHTGQLAEGYRISLRCKKSGVELWAGQIEHTSIYNSPPLSQFLRSNSMSLRVAITRKWASLTFYTHRQNQVWLLKVCAFVICF